MLRKCPNEVTYLEKKVWSIHEQPLCLRLVFAFSQQTNKVQDSLYKFTVNQYGKGILNFGI